jgi:divalent metal cation (Fe/Co/Zn/Cd) transporter
MKLAFSKAPAGSYRYAQEHLLWALGIQLVLAGLQIWLGYRLLSLAVQASGIYSLVRGFSCLAGLIGLGALERREKPGSWMASGWSVLLPPAILVLAAWEILGMGYERLAFGAHSARFAWWGLLFLGGLLCLSVMASNLESQGTLGVRNRLYHADGMFRWTHFLALFLAMAAVALAAFWSLGDNLVAAIIVAGALYTAGEIVLKQLAFGQAEGAVPGKGSLEEVSRPVVRTAGASIYLQIDPGRILNPMELSALEKRAVVALEENLPVEARIKRAPSLLSQ